MQLTYEEIIADKELRIEAWRQSFRFWFTYHFWRKMKRFQKDRCNALQNRDLSILIEAFRASRKTTIVRWFVCRCIAYKIEPSIIVQSYEDSLSAERVREVAKMLFKKSVVEDHWYLFPIEKKDDVLMSKKSTSNFESTTGVKVAAKSLGQTIRWANTFDMEEEMSARPTLLILDDIDVIKSVTNIDIIVANEKKILNETMWALDPLQRRVIFLWNTINEDWVVPRFRNKYKNQPSRKIFRQPLFNDKWENQRPEVFTDKEIDKLKADWISSWNNNYLLIPSQAGNWVFIRSYFNYFLTSWFEDSSTWLTKNDLKCGIFCDPAFSTSDVSDDAVVIWAAEHKITKRKYLIDWYADTSAPSKTIAALIVMYNNMVNDWFNPQFISVENVTISKRQTEFIKDLKTELLRFNISCPVYLYEPRTNKNARIKDNCESPMSQWWLLFNRNMTDRNFVTKAENQFLEYPVWDHDDIIDTISQMFEVFKTKTNWEVKKKTLKKVRSPEKWEFIDVYW